MSFFRRRPSYGRQAVRVLVLAGSWWAHVAAAQSATPEVDAAAQAVASGQDAATRVASETDAGAPAQNDVDAAAVSAPLPLPPVAPPPAPVVPVPTAPGEAELGVGTDDPAAREVESESARNTLKSVIVTADRRETNLQTTPIAISAFGPAQLQERAVGSIRDLAGQVPNLSIARANISYTTQTYSLRGVGETDPIQEPVLAIYVDDVYQTRQLGAMMDFNDIERIELLRGPQGTLYGRNSSAGALRVLSKDPGNEFHTNDSLTYGRFNQVKALASVSGALVRDKLFASLSFLHNRRDGFVWDPTLNRDVNRINVDAARIKLRWTPTEKWEVQATFNGMLDRSDSRSYIPKNQPGGGFSKHRSYSEVPPYQNLDQGGASLRVAYKVDPRLELKSISSTSGFDLNPVWYDNDGEAALIQKNLIHYADKAVTQEFQVNGHYRWVDFSSGLFYLFERFYVQRDGYSRRNTMPTDPVTTPSNYGFARAHNFAKTHSFAVFGNANVKPTRWLTLTAGLRETVEFKSFHFNNKGLNLQGQAVSQAIEGDADETWTALTPKGTISVQYTADVMHYVSYSRGFKSGGFDNRATLLALAQRPFNPEYVNSYETGLKTELLRHRLRANLTGFYNDYKDLQVSYVDPAYPGSSIRGNAGKAHTAGAEIETDARLPYGFALGFAGGYLKAVYDDYKNAGGMGVNADGNPLVNAPKWNLTSSASYEIPLPVPGFVKLAADLQWASTYNSNALARPEDKNPAQTFVNGTLSWTSPDEHVSAWLSGRNLGDSQKSVSSTNTPGTGVRYFNFPDPRTVMFTLKYQR